MELEDVRKAKKELENNINIAIWQFIVTTRFGLKEIRIATQTWGHFMPEDVYIAIPEVKVTIDFDGF